jgi:hypothetical protein
MPAYSFMKQFTEPVEKLLKTHTMRNKRKRPTVIGDKLSLYYAQRTKYRRLLLKTTCTFVHDATVTDHDVFINHKIVKNKNEFAVSDGFKDFSAMVQFWKDTHELPWSGELISWGNKDPQEIFCK